MSKHSKDYLAGRQKGLDETIALLQQMERRYRLWSHNNPGIEGMQASAKGKIEAIATAFRAITNLKNQPPK